MTTAIDTTDYAAAIDRTAALVNLNDLLARLAAGESKIVITKSLVDAGWDLKAAWSLVKMVAEAA